MIDMIDNLISKTALKKKAKDVHAFGKILASLTDKQIAQMELPENIIVAIKDLKNIKKSSAQKRQSLYLAKLLRGIDLSKAYEFVDQLKFESKSEIRKHHQAEVWRDKLIKDVSNLTNLVNEMEGIEIQRLRSLVTNAQKEIKQEGLKKHQRELFRYLKEIFQ